MKTLLIALAASAAFTLPALAQAQTQQNPPSQMQDRDGKQGITPMSLRADQISQIQEALKSKGLYQGEVDGKWGPETAAAMRQFDKQQGQQAGTPDDGRIDPQTLAALGLDPARFGAAPTSPPSTAPGAPPSRTQPGSPDMKQPGSPGSPGEAPGLKPDNSQ